MMESSSRLSLLCQDMFNDNTTYCNNPSTALGEPLTLNKGNIYHHNLVVDISKDVVEYPIVIKTQVEQALVLRSLYEEMLERGGTPDHEPIDKIVYPLYVNSPDVKKRTFDTTIKEFFKYTDRYNRLKKVIITNDYFYGAKGMILDKNFNLLLLCTISVHKKKEYNAKQDDCKYLWVYDRLTCYVSPEVVYKDKDNFLYKGIVFKLIPHLSYYTMHMPYPRGHFRYDKDCVSYDNVKIVIDYIDSWVHGTKWIHCPQMPDPNTYSDDALNDLALQYMDDINEIIDNTQTIQ